MIDLTEDVRRADNAAAEGASDSQHACPICSKMFDGSEIQLHANKCIKRQGEGKKAQCSLCSRVFESSLLDLHMEQCGGKSSSDEELLLPVRRARLTGPGRGVGSAGARKSPCQLLLRSAIEENGMQCKSKSILIL